MNLQGKIVLHAAQYAAPYEGNFIKSLKRLEEDLCAEGATMAYCLPRQAEGQPWFPEFRQLHKVYTVDPWDAAGVREMLDVLRPSIVHCHFEGYDVTVSKAIGLIDEYSPKVVWHLHDWFRYVKNPLKAIYMRWCFFRHYCLNANGVSVIGVCDEIVRFVSRFKQMGGTNFYRKQTILNGIDLNRVERPNVNATPHNPFTFLTFGGRNVQKRVDIVFMAFREIFKRNADASYRLLITEGTDTRETIEKLCGGVMPRWCQLIKQTDNINAVFAMADCFISAAEYETFSYAVCEASIYGLPVIQSNIPGTKWNNANPSTFLFSPGSVGELLAQIERVAGVFRSLPDARCRSRQNNLKYSLVHWSKEIIQFYQSL
jgi:glycosyltransferase involved in cell wall biosynthesis